ncbi:MAG: hypothetical protein HY791_25940 [Deltaproteobacteria bacterium]|nr:hypothetical protein [Deltaproteobacteria bacterium]
MSVLDELIPMPRIREIDHVDLAARQEVVFEQIRHGDLSRSPLVRALLALHDGHAESRRRPGFKLSDLVSTPEQPGFVILSEDAPRQIVVGAIAKLWLPRIELAHVADSSEFRLFREPGYAKLAWTVRVIAVDEISCRVELELYLDVTDETAWASLTRFFHISGRRSELVRRSALGALVDEFGTPEAHRNERPLPGDSLMTDAADQLTDSIDIGAAPEQIWPWLLQMGRTRGGFYSIDVFGNGGERSARELHPELAAVREGDLIPASRSGDEGFEVLSMDPPRSLVLGTLLDVDQGRQVPFASPRPSLFWQVTWTFFLEPVGLSTRVYARARAAYSPSESFRAVLLKPAHRIMQATQLRNLASRVERHVPSDDWHDVLDGLGGAAVAAFALLTPFMKNARSHYGLSEALALRRYPGDDRILEPRWGWTHAIEIEASAERVWPWVAQIGADRAGFYSYQWLENLAGCGVVNAETIHPDWAVRRGSTLSLHPKAPPLPVVEVVDGTYFLAHGAADQRAKAAKRPWSEVTWLLLVEPIEGDRCRFVSRFRANSSDDLPTRLAMGPGLVEPVGFAMDRRMLLGVKQRVEATHQRLIAPRS